MAALLLEVGLLLILIPWSSFWDHNYFAELSPLVRSLVRNDYVRGAVSGLGLLNLYAAVAEFADAVLHRGAPSLEGRHEP